MSTRISLLILSLVLGVGLVCGVIGGFMLAPRGNSAAPVAASAGLVLQRPEQDDYVILIAEAFVNDRDLNLAKDRLKRLPDKDLAKRVETLAQLYAPQGDLIAANLAVLALALGSKDNKLSTLAATPTPRPAVLAIPADANRGANAVVALAATPAPIKTLAPTRTPAPPTPRPPTSTPRPTAVPAAPAPGTDFNPPLANIRNIYFKPADVQPGQQYWHLTKVVYCDINEKRFNCPDMPGGNTGTSIYVMTGGADINAIRDGVNYGDRRDVIGDKKMPSDMCNCTWTFLVSNYEISVRGAPSDTIGGFCLCTSNGATIPDGHAHVRYFLYYSLVTR